MVLDQTGGLNGMRRHDYLPFGEELTAPTAGRTAAQGYTGDGVRQQFTEKERDTETGLDYFLARYYASTQGRFNSADSFGGSVYDPQSLNRYTYVLNSPPIFIDPDGHTQTDADCVKYRGGCLWKGQDPEQKGQDRQPEVIKKPFVPLGSPNGNPLGDILDGPIIVRDSGGTITTTDPILATLPPSIVDSVAGYTWSGIKQYTHFEVGMVNQWMPATKWARNGIEWAVGREIIDENSTAYKAGGWYFVGVETVASFGTATSERLAVKVTTPIRDQLFRWGIGSFKLHSGNSLKNVLHFHLGPGRGLMKHHLPYQFRGWRGNLWNNLKKWRW
jgi:RHS repeat-associated protein